MQPSQRPTQLVRVLRIWNTPTAWADILVGACMAGTVGVPSTAVLLGATTFLYWSGFLQNDIIDYGEDAAVAPSRPLPSGAVSLQAVRACWLVCVVGALVLLTATGQTALGIGVALLLCITYYNLYARRKGLLVGACVMGLCRGLNVMLGATQGYILQALHPAVALSVYVMGLTLIADDRNTQGPLNMLGYAACTVATLWAAVHALSYANPISTIILLAPLVWVIFFAVLAPATRTGSVVRWLIWGIILLNGAFCLENYPVLTLAVATALTVIRVILLLLCTNITRRGDTTTETYTDTHGGTISEREDTL